MKNKFLRLKVLILAMVLILFILSLYVLSVGEFNSLFSKDTWTTISNLANIFALIGVVASVLFILPLRYLNTLEQRVKQKMFPNNGDQIPDKTYDALLFTVSKSDIPLWMLKVYQPKAIGLLGSKEVTDVLEEISNEAEKLGIQVYSRILVDADIVARAQDETLEIINDLVTAGFNNQALDITGGKTPMSIGAFLAAEKSGINSLYVTAKYNKKGPISESIKPILLSTTASS